MNKILYTIIFASLICTPVYAQDEFENIRAKRVETYVNDSIKYDRARDDSRYRLKRRPYCVTKKVTDEFGYIHYFEICK